MMGDESEKSGENFTDDFLREALESALETSSEPSAPDHRRPPQWLTHAAEDWLTRTCRVNATPGYAAPERWLNSAQTLPATDQYSLAATLWHLLSGQIPMGSFSPLPAHAPPRLEAVLRRALAPLPENRYPDLNLFHLALVQSEGLTLRWLRRLSPFLAIAAILILAWLAFFSPPKEPPPPAYPREFQSESLQVLPTRQGFARMSATLEESGATRIVLQMDNRDLFLGQTTIGEVRFLDAQDRVLHHFVSNPFGINGRLIPGAPSQRTELFGGQIPPHLLPRIATATFHVHPGNWKMNNRHEVFKRALKDDLQELLLPSNTDSEGK